MYIKQKKTISFVSMSTLISLLMFVFRLLVSFLRIVSIYIYIRGLADQDTHMECDQMMFIFRKFPLRST